MPSESLVAPPWMKLVLRSAGVYNIIWGLWVIGWPQASLRVSGFAPEGHHPALWQCLGMVIGVYGVGYWLAARDPYRHWPMVFVGLLGKVLGPVGMAVSVAQGTLPPSAARLLICNDLIWWIPFTMILWGAVRFHSSQVENPSGSESFKSLLHSFRSQNGNSLLELSTQQPHLVVFLRHAGCTFCREALSDLAAWRRAARSRGETPMPLALVHMSPEVEIAPLFARYELQAAERFSDPDQQLYRAFDLRLGRFTDLFGASVISRGLRAALLEGHGFGPIQGNGFRMPGVFVLDQGKIIRSYRHETAADRPDYAELACPLPSG
ncbi:SelL-related redox protein [Planctomicrobium sp. SH664]|uniref:SelL-related redox protein n=1 Tax=Planctomicrobium sp. SH664 TaxID=3448125 RepID=UPI003F5C6312